MGALADQNLKVNMVVSSPSLLWTYFPRAVQRSDVHDAGSAITAKLPGAAHPSAPQHPSPQAITNDPKERVACQAYRRCVSGIATLLLSATLLPMVDCHGGDKAKGYQLAMTVLAIIEAGMFPVLLCQRPRTFALPRSDAR